MNFQGGISVKHDASSLPPATPADSRNETSATETESFRNDKVIVKDCVLSPRQQLALTGSQPSVTVYLTDATLNTTPKGGKTFGAKIKRGAAIFEAGAAASIRNVGSTEVRLLRIQFVGSGLDETWGATGIPGYRVLLENRYARVYEIRIAAGTQEPLHTHYARVAICLSGAKMSHLLPDGRKEPSGLESGTFAWRLGQTHVGQNLDTKDLWVIAVEPK
jgi:hypothetical protein